MNELQRGENLFTLQIVESCYEFTFLFVHFSGTVFIALKSVLLFM